MKYILLLMLSIGMVSCAQTNQRKIASDDIIILQERSVKLKKSGNLWNSLGEGLKNQIRIRFTRPSRDKKSRNLDAFYWFDMKNFLTNGLVAGATGLGKVKLTNKEEMYLNIENGNIYLGERIIGFAYQHPNHDEEGSGIINDGFKFTVPIKIDEQKNTITIY